MKNKYVPPEVLLNRISKRLQALSETSGGEAYYENIIELAIAVKLIKEELDDIRKITTYVDLLQNHLETVKLLEWYRENYKHTDDLEEAIDAEIARRTAEIDKVLLERKYIPKDGE